MGSSQMKGKSYALRNQRGQIQKCAKYWQFWLFEEGVATKVQVEGHALRLWFRALPIIDRVLVDLTTKVAGNARSFARTIHRG
jgi:hypothetical protein